MPPTALPDAVMEWKTNRPWTAVLAHYYAAFPVDGMALDPKAMGRSSTRGVPTGETHNIIPQGAARAPGLSPYLQVRSDPQNPSGSVVSLYVYD